MRYVKMASIGAVMGLGLMMAACSSDPEPFNETASSVTLKYDGDQIETATNQAGKYCASRGGVARLRNVNEQSDGQNIAVYDCVMDMAPASPMTQQTAPATPMPMQPAR
ncbi:MAG: hypothetical protein PW790_13605 [Parvibaculaceae bacterium]|nr:hypothetical protein [Parvibaculaceae bacterium]